MTRKTIPLLAALALFLILPQLIAVKYYLHLSILALIWVIMAQGQNLIQGYTGYVSIVQAGFMGIGAYSTALMGSHFGLPSSVTIILAPLVTACFALLAGYPSLRVKGHYFAIVTLAFNMVIFIILLNFTDLTNGEAGISGIAKPGYGRGALIDFNDRQVYYYFVLAVAVLMTALAAVIVRSRIGQILIAIRQNEDLVASVGVAAWKYKLFAFVVSAMFAGLAGALYAHYQSFINPEIFGVAQSLDAILAVIIGGSGTLTGPVIGAFFVVFLPEYLRFADSFRLILYGLILVLATIFMPRGIVGVARDLAGRIRGQ
ncbi:branched-chain amino acid ABC transporter permease [Paracoccus seriniphilus]|uniref:Amino acid/amide ABC transporter membrane protein 2, HAAT family n=1 Tax=Paracoccus seriniphilus TaxID=184748 RepID=A0A239PTJ9_9RHOB|nr:branched-chain amino acid ABC transporter permease [Paracoccus seriniphilus]WCR16393.1 branched-chain amino acid ABC transporter permease [Paracoccus seriniphilus]SNT73458.1 amino acid/amide ABC transporter membrane protein 2, HAAT family [Paracoccus seriniphilus]